MSIEFTSDQLAAAQRAAHRDETEIVHHTGEPAQACSCPPVRALTPAEHVALSMRVANRAVISMIEDLGHRVTSPEVTLYDLRPMIDLNRWDPGTVHEHCEAITLAFDAGLIRSHPAQTDLVQIIAPTGL
jgi:hypothetical protein